MRELLAEAEEHDDRRAQLAIEIFCYRVRKYIGAYLAALGGARRDRLHRRHRRELARRCARGSAQGLEWLGVSLDAAANAPHVGGREGRISADGGRGSSVWVIPTDEELLIARDTFRVVTGATARF